MCSKAEYREKTTNVKHEKEVSKTLNATLDIMFRLGMENFLLLSHSRKSSLALSFLSNSILTMVRDREIVITFP